MLMFFYGGALLAFSIISGAVAVKHDEWVLAIMSVIGGGFACACFWAGI